jgi:hypothetical protein
MNKIIEVNAEYAYAVVEPGVTFTELYDYCVKNKFNVWPSVPSLGWGSVVGNTLDRGAGFTPTAMHTANCCERANLPFPTRHPHISQSLPSAPVLKASSCSRISVL